MSRRLYLSAVALAVTAALPASALAGDSGVGANLPPLPAPAPAVPAGAPSATQPAGTTLPSVADVSPLELRVGDVMTIGGAGFVSGRWHNQVVFARPGIRPVFALADVASSQVIRVRVPAKLLPFLARRDGQAIPTRFHVSVLAGRLGPRFTATHRSPVIGPPAADQPVPGGADCNGDGAVDTPAPQALGLAVVGLPSQPAPVCPGR